MSTERIATESQTSPAEVAEEQAADLAPTTPPLAESAPGERRFLAAVVDLIQDVAIAVVVCVLFITYVVQAFRVDGTSMSRSLLDGERILVNKLVYRFEPVERGDVVVFWYPDDPDVSFIKRVIGLPGDEIEIRHGTVFVNGVALVEPYVAARNGDGQSYSAIHIRPGHYFVLGDNRRGSNDSRSWGLVPRRYIYGEAFLRIWPPDEFGPIE